MRRLPVNLLAPNRTPKGNRSPKGPGWIVVDNFAGGGGVSTGIKMATGRDPEIGINHKAEALAMYRANHPDSETYETSVWEIDPLAVCRNRRVGLAHFSPDCTDFSKAKGGRPKRDEAMKSRALAWVVIKWARRVRPRVITLENVEEWLDWGPLRPKRHKNGRPMLDPETGEQLLEPDPTRRGKMFAKWLRQLEKLGYRVEWCQLRGADYGSPTIRKRLFVIARCDGQPIVWPLPTHRKPESPWVKAGLCQPWRPIANEIDWTLPCPSIFLTKEEGRALGVNRPLKESTMKRIFQGTRRYVLEAKNPFIVLGNHGGDWFRGQGIHEPFQTATASRDAWGVIDPTLAPFVQAGQHGGAIRSVEDPLHTVTASDGDCNCVVAPLLDSQYGNSQGRPVDAPCPTIMAGGEGKQALIAPYMVPRYGEAPGQSPRCRSVEAPLATIVTTDNGSQLVSPFLASPAHSKTTGRAPNHWSAEEPLRTTTVSNDKCIVAPILDTYHGPKGDDVARSGEVTEPLRTVDTSNRHAMVQAFLAQHNTGVVGRSATEPLSTITTLGTQQQVVEATFIGQHNGGRVGKSPDEPLTTITHRGTQQTVTSAFLSHLYTSNTRGGHGDPGHPLKTITAGGNHHAAVLAFLAKYYGNHHNHQACSEPLHTATTKERFGLVTVNSVEYQIVDIGMRMLTARELFNAQGFPRDYKIDVWCDNRKNDKGQRMKPGLLTKSAQIRCCGNSVCPQVMCALTRANCQFLIEPQRGKRSKSAAA